MIRAVADTHALILYLFDDKSLSRNEDNLVKHIARHLSGFSYLHKA
jgi:hypothetical protein